MAGTNRVRIQKASGLKLSAVRIITKAVYIMISIGTLCGKLPVCRKVKKPRSEERSRKVSPFTTTRQYTIKTPRPITHKGSATYT
jgi:hypothetical protein